MLSLPRSAWAFVAVAAALSAWNLGAPELTDTDESRSGLLVRDMVDGGRWLLPRTPDGILCEKPPAYYVSAAILARAFGLNEWTLRAPSALAALGTLVVTAWLAGRLGSPRAAWIAAVALASNVVFLRWSRQAMVDMTLTFFLTAGLAAYVAARGGKVPVRAAAVVCGLSFGLAVLSKGPLGLVLPIAVIGGDALVCSRGKFWKLPIPWGRGALAFAIGVTIPSVWYYAAYRAGGMAFLKVSLVESIFMPLGDAEDTGTAHKKYLFYYFWNQPVFLLAALPLLPAAVCRLVRRDAVPARSPLGCWAGFGLLVFLVASNKRHYYLLPLQPAFAVLIALGADRALEEGRSRLLAWGSGTAAALLGLGCAGVLAVGLRPTLLSPWVAADVLEAIRRQSAMVIFLAALGIALAAGTAATVRRGPECLVRMTAGLALFTVLGFSGVVDPIVAELNRNKTFVARARPLVGPAPAAVQLPFTTYGLHFYWPAPLPREKDAAAKAEFVFVRRDHLDLVPSGAEILAVRPYGTDGRKDVLLVRRK